MPGIELVRNYRREWFASDLIAGLSIAAVAVPIGIAYAQFAGFAPVVGIYSCILPAIAYASSVPRVNWLSIPMLPPARSSLLLLLHSRPEMPRATWNSP